MPSRPVRSEVRFPDAAEASDYVTLLGEVGNIWPVSILDDPARGYQLKRVNHAPSEGQEPQLAPASPDDDDDDDDF